MFHHISTWRETHAGQTDLQETGFLFAWMFLPSANLLAAGTVFAFASGRMPLVLAFWNRVYGAFTEVIAALSITL
jgi:hypothetical protein